MYTQSQHNVKQIMDVGTSYVWKWSNELVLGMPTLYVHTWTNFRNNMLAILQVCTFACRTLKGYIKVEGAKTKTLPKTNIYNRLLIVNTLLPWTVPHGA